MVRLPLRSVKIGHFSDVVGLSCPAGETPRSFAGASCEGLNLAGSVIQRELTSVNLLEPGLATLLLNLAQDGGVERRGGRLALRCPHALGQLRLDYMPGPCSCRSAALIQSGEHVMEVNADSSSRHASAIGASRPFSHALTSAVSASST